MKKILAILILIFSLQTPSQADDIQDLQIEGISIGDSLLDYFSEDKIINNTYKKIYKNTYVVFYSENLSNVYDYNTVTYKLNDKKFIIYGTMGGLNFSNNINECYKKQLEIVNEIESEINNIKKKEWGDLIRNEEEESTYRPITFEDNSNNSLSISCYFFPKKQKINNLKVSIKSKEFKEFVTKIAVKVD